MEAMTPYVKEGWAIGDGTKMYMADFYIGSAWTDVLCGKGTWLEEHPEYLKNLHAKYPEFVAYGKRFEGACRVYLAWRNDALYKSKPRW